MLSPRLLLPKNRYLTPQDAVLVEDVGTVEEKGGKGIKRVKSFPIRMEIQQMLLSQMYAWV